MLQAPIRACGYDWGVLRVERPVGALPWTRDDARFLASLADLAAIAVVTTRQLKAERHQPAERRQDTAAERETIGIPDTLTGLMRRAEFMERVRRAAEKLSRRPSYVAASQPTVGSEIKSAAQAA